MSVHINYCDNCRVSLSDDATRTEGYRLLCPRCWMEVVTTHLVLPEAPE